MPAAPPPPPPPSLGVPPSGSAQPDDRGQLLKSIRAGATLRKTVTVDKSAPAIAGKVRDGSGSGGGGSGCATSGRPAVGGPNLGGLFSAGMPKLKATGLRNNAAEQESAIGTPSVKRGPPPIPPPATQKPSSETSPEQPHVPKSFGKPTLAPKPPPPPASSSSSSFGHAIQKPSPPPKKLNLIGGAASVSRAQSMRLPRSPPVLAHATPSSLHQSQDCLNETVAAAQHRPVGINRALRPPIARPPSPPISRIPREAPPPPATRLAPPPPPPPPSRLAVVTAPSMPPPPPPPPYRSTSMHQRLAPPPPPPPTPPTRLASANAPSILVRNGPPTLANLDLELRFADKFHSIVNFPNPSPFRGFPKVYNSKNAAKQQAPGPPPSSAPGTMLRSNDSSGGLLLLNSGEASRQRHRPLEN